MSKKSLMAQLGQILLDLIRLIICAVYRFMLWMSCKVLKRYFGIETPIYRYWHCNHAAYMQRRLDREHQLISATL